MTIDLNVLVTLAGCSALLVFWLMHFKSGWRGFLLMGAGCALIVLGYKSDGRLASLAGILMDGIVIALALLSISMLARAKRRVPRYQAPKTINGTCSTCAKVTQLTFYKQGWLCMRCARRASALAA